MMSRVVRSNVKRLSAPSYIGRVAVHFTLCLTERKPYFKLEERVAIHRSILKEEVDKAGCVAYVYCFMPDHLHVILLGVRDDAAPKKAIERFKQRSGYALKDEPVKWQKGYYDHILRTNEDTPRQVLMSLITRFGPGYSTIRFRILSADALAPTIGNCWRRSFDDSGIKG